MKKLLFLFIALMPLLNACSSEDEPVSNNPVPVQDKYYRITYEGGLDYPVRIVAHEYSTDGVNIKNNSLDMAKNTSRDCVAEKNAKYVIIEIRVTEPTLARVGWLENPFTLTAGSTVDIVIGPSTVIKKDFAIL